MASSVPEKSANAASTMAISVSSAVRAVMPTALMRSILAQSSVVSCCFMLKVLRVDESRPSVIKLIKDPILPIKMESHLLP